MKQIIVAIFAHPDDEAFGPSGTLYKLAQEHDVYLICVTSGQAGENHLKYSSTRTIGEIRREELRKSAKILGIKKVLFLGFEDGSLCNNTYHELARKIERKLRILKPDTLLTFEQKGVSGHIDHITVSMVTTFVFRKLPFIQTVLFYGTLIEKAADRRDYFIYFPPGYDRDEFDKIVDVSDVWDKKVQAMSQHKSQEKDMKNVLESAARFPKEEHFFVLERKDI